MRKTLLLLLVLTGFAIAAHAQTTTAAKTDSVPPLLMSIGIDAGPVLSNNTFSSSTGVSIKLEIPCQSPKAFLTFTSGINSLSVKKTPATDTLQNGHYVPLLVGFKYFIIKSIFIEGDIGDSFNINDSYSGYQNAFTWSPMVGVSIPLNKPNTAVDIAAYYEGRNSNNGNVNQAAIRVAYKFGL